MTPEGADKRPATADVVTRRSVVAFVADYVQRLDIWQNQAMNVVGQRLARTDSVARGGKIRGEELLAELEAAKAAYLAALDNAPEEIRRHDIALDVLRSLDALIRALRS